MKWLLSMFTGRRDSIALSNILADLPKAIVWGMLTGPLIGLFFQLLLDRAMLRQWWVHPEIVFWSGLAGVIFSVAFWLTGGVGNRFMRHWLTGHPTFISTPIYVAYNVIAASLAMTAAAGAVTHLPGPVKFEFPFFWQIVAIDGVLGGVVALLIGGFVKLKKQVEAAQSELREKESNERRLAEVAAKAQALSLQAQINPHFFFNTLNTISVLIETDPAAAKETIGRLADMFRYTLSCSHGEAVALEQEMQFVRDYLGIEQARFQKRLRVEWPQEPLPDVKVPGLVMQPLVENAVKHGIAPSLEGGTLQIVVADGHGRARIAVRNTSDATPDLSDARVFRSGHALENVRARLRLYTGKGEPLVLSRHDGWTESVITL